MAINRRAFVPPCAALCRLVPLCAALCHSVPLCAAFLANSRQLLCKRFRPFLCGDEFSRKEKARNIFKLRAQVQAPFSHESPHFLVSSSCCSLVPTTHYPRYLEGCSTVRQISEKIQNSSVRRQPVHCPLAARYGGISMTHIS